MNAALDALWSGRSVKEATEEVAKTISTRTVGKPLAPPSSRAPKPSTRGVKSARPSSRGRSSSASKFSEASKSPRASGAKAKEDPKIAAQSAKDSELMRTDDLQSFADVSAGLLEVAPADEGGLRDTNEVDPEGQNAQEISSGVVLTKEAESEPAEGAPPRRETTIVSRGTAKEVGSKRPAPSDAPAPVAKKPRASGSAAPALPPLEKKKTSVVPLLSTLDNDILNAEDITHQSPATVVAKIIWERMFGGVTQASNPHLLALSSHLASSTQKQVAFRA
ncbi:protein ENL-like [Manihot esculenta]|uniref:protein ENL-like n=1 Tax=Manihot esculenta TaxID=3983 RepID=UPI000B5D660F|nr:protein ENL-like [Manihot esculenta]